ncbi:MAG: ligase-associated DNA damage response DEXH box helicase, partial [Flavobacteriales bacterium]|nr:ligase-associated DNA damage response DEXH box helicase [Flavobacteriales bacterium]
PIRALTKEIQQAADRLIAENNLTVSTGIRTGDTAASEKMSQRKSMPNFLVTTPESIHLLFCTKKNHTLFTSLTAVVVDEWHDLLSTKRGVMAELALAHFKTLSPQVNIWGISATIGNIEEARHALLGMDRDPSGVTIRASLKKETRVVSLVPDKVETMPWSGHLGSRMVKQVCEIIEKSESTLIFTNVRSQCEWWYRQLIEAYPELAGIMAIHHGSLDREIRHWVEDALYEGRLKAVVCTSSLDLGVDFGPVETIIQVGGPKGVARFIQRSGRSGHRPGAVSNIYFLPAHTLELIEAAALRQAIADQYLEEREPVIRAFDVLVQYLVSLATGDGLDEMGARKEVATTHAFSTMNDAEWKWVMAFIRSGGPSLTAYPDYQKVSLAEDGLYRITSHRIARRHRLSVGAIVSDTMVAVKLGSSTIGHLEETFLSSLNDGEAFWFAGNCLELKEIRGLTAHVRRSTKKQARIPSWQGGRLPLSSKMSDMLRRKLDEAVSQKVHTDPELDQIAPILELQRQHSHVPQTGEFLVEIFHSTEGHHAVFYPFEGRFVHEGMAALLAYRISQLMPISFSLAYNDYGFELLSDQPFPVEELLRDGILHTDNLQRDLMQSVNSTQLMLKRFKDVATISGLIFRGFPGEPIKERHLQASAGLLYKVFTEYEPDSLLLQQAMDEVIHYQLEWKRLVTALNRIAGQRLVITHPGQATPFAFPIMVDRLREKMTSESLETRIQKMLKE